MGAPPRHGVGEEEKVKAKVTLTISTLELLDPEFFAEGSARASFSYARVAYIPFFPREGDWISFGRRDGEGLDVYYAVARAVFNIDSGELDVELEGFDSGFPALESGSYLDAESLIWDYKEMVLPEQFTDHERELVPCATNEAVDKQPRGLVESKERYGKMCEDF